MDWDRREFLGAVGGMAVAGGVEVPLASAAMDFDAFLAGRLAGACPMRRALGRVFEPGGVVRSLFECVGADGGIEARSLKTLWAPLYQSNLGGLVSPLTMDQTVAPFVRAEATLELVREGAIAGVGQAGRWGTRVAGFPRAVGRAVERVGADFILASEGGLHLLGPELTEAIPVTDDWIALIRRAGSLGGLPVFGETQPYLFAPARIQALVGSRRAIRYHCQEPLVVVPSGPPEGEPRGGLVARGRFEVLRPDLLVLVQCR